MGRTLAEVKRYGTNWDTVRKKVLRRDEYTCQRCGHQSGPHAGDEGRVLQAHHIEKVSDGGSNDLPNLRTLCRPCHGVQHPDNDVFDDSRPWARVYSSQSADEAVAYVNSNRERESIEEFLERKGRGHCSRCGNPSEDSPLYVYPNLDLADRGEYTNPGEKFSVLCGPCTGLVYDSDDDEHIGQRLYRTDGEKVGRRITNLTDLQEQAQIVGANTTRKLNATREPVNWKEWFLFRSPYRLVHTLWRRYGTAILTAFLFLFTGPYFDHLMTSMNASTGVGPMSEWFIAAGGGFLVSLTLALIIRWSIAALTGSIWERLDDSVEPHHFTKRTWFTLRRRLKTVLYLSIAYGVLGGIQLLLGL